MFSEESITELLSAPKLKAGMMDFLSAHIKKEGLHDKIEYNELNIITDFNLYNLGFAKDELHLENDRIALLLNILWCLLDFSEEPNHSHDSHSPSAQIHTEPTYQDTGVTHQNAQDNAKSQEEDDAFNKQLDQKFMVFKELIQTFALQNIPYQIKVFSNDEITKIMHYVGNTYFKHFRLYSYVLSNKQLCDVKNITVYVDLPLQPPPLLDALDIGKENLAIEDEERVILFILFNHSFSGRIGRSSCCR
jgi:hypothetical protein